MRTLVQGIIAAVALLSAVPANAAEVWATFWGSTEFSHKSQTFQIQFWFDETRPDADEGVYGMYYNGWMLEGSGSDYGHFSLNNQPYGTSFQIYSTENMHGQTYTGGFSTPAIFSLADVASKPVEFSAGRGASIWLDYSVYVNSTIPHYGSLFAEKVTLSATSPVPLTNVPPVPEPTTWALMIAGFGAIGLALRRRPQRSNKFGSFTNLQLGQ